MLRFIKTLPPLICIIIVTAINCQTNVIPAWFYDAFKSNRLDKKYVIVLNLKPFCLQADFNGGGIVDVVALITKKTNKKVLLFFMGKRINTLYLVQERLLMHVVMILNGQTNGRFTRSLQHLKRNLIKEQAIL